jgi:hypothetical protein
MDGAAPWVAHPAGRWRAVGLMVQAAPRGTRRVVVVRWTSIATAAGAGGCGWARPRRAACPRTNVRRTRVRSVAGTYRVSIRSRCPERPLICPVTRSTPIRTRSMPTTCGQRGRTQKPRSEGVPRHGTSYPFMSFHARSSTTPISCTFTPFHPVKRSDVTREPLDFRRPSWTTHPWTRTNRHFSTEIVGKARPGSW